ncbi:MAG TPA: hypothetical protein VME22_21005 [Solirubrobacteraceae bacterium]|nr:hypothetical protein [Solirubrobacteraceae bacterium]
MTLAPAIHPVHDRRAHELRALSTAARWGAADPHLVRAIAVRVSDGDGGAWVREWTASGGEAWASARRHPSASEYLQAASFYGAALALIDESDGLVEESRLWERQRECWDRAVELLGGERLSIPYEETTLPGYFFAAGTGTRPLAVIDHGGRVATSAAWAAGGAAAHARGYHWMTFDGPGRQAALRRQGLVLRRDWERVLTPVLDAMIDRPEVDSEHVAVVGVDHAGYGVPRALAFEHRFAAAVALPGILDASTPWMEALPVRARLALYDADRETFNRELHLAGLFDPDTHNRLRRMARDYDISRLPLYDLAHRIGTFQLGPELESIATPLLVCPTGPESSWAIQAGDLCERAPGAQQVASDGPDDEPVWDWVDERL